MRDKDKQSNAFWAWAKCLGELIFWAGEPDAETTTRDGWREAFRIDIQDKGDRALDAAPDDVTRNQVIRSRSLACDLVRMLNTCGDLNSVPCRNWPTTERNIVEELTKLKSRFAELGYGEQRAEPVAVTATGSTKPEAAKVNRTRPRNRRPAKSPPKALTDRQSESLRLYGECNGNMSEVARRMGVAPPTAMQHYDAANVKLGITLSERARTTRLAADQHGQGVKGLPARRRGKGVKVDD